MLKIIPLGKTNKSHLKRLNVAWLETYFFVEPNDLVQLENPEREIIDKGGYIFFAEFNGQIVGTVSLLKKDYFTYELGKMAVYENCQGHGIGKQLLLHTITHAKTIEATKLILFTNSILKSAISLYQKHGFEQVDLGDSVYKRSDVKMELNLR
jgi:N-acetylglutamate synthase-like GNAT family acetyltransferase